MEAREEIRNGNKYILTIPEKGKILFSQGLRLTSFEL
jgi:hypothetical protein